MSSCPHCAASLADGAIVCGACDRVLDAAAFLTDMPEANEFDEKTDASLLARVLAPAGIVPVSQPGIFRIGAGSTDRAPPGPPEPRSPICSPPGSRR